MRLKVGLLAALTLAAVACGSDAVDENADASASTTTEAGPITEATDDALDVRALVEALAADEMNGRDNQTPGSSAAQELLVGELRRFAEPAFPDAAGDDGYLQPFDTGTNVLAVIPGGELADEFVMIGAHYDHLGNDCGGVSEGDDICNGATDNAAGVAAAMEVARAVTAEGAPDRSLVVALWDAEEDGLEGSGHYVNDPAVPLAQTVAYLNFDNVGTNLLPSLASTTILIGAETGGSRLVEAAARATEASTLDTVALSLLFGQGRSDHAVLVSAGVPSVFFSDATSGCYHTVEDDIDVVDFAKLDQQIATATGGGGRVCVVRVAGRHDFFTRWDRRSARAAFAATGPSGSVAAA